MHAQPSSCELWCGLYALGTYGLHAQQPTMLLFNTSPTAGLRSATGPYPGFDAQGYTSSPSEPWLLLDFCWETSIFVKWVGFACANSQVFPGRRIFIPYLVLKSWPYQLQRNPNWYEIPRNRWKHFVQGVHTEYRGSRHIVDARPLEVICYDVGR